MADSESPAGIVDLVSMSLRRERARTGLSLTELAKRNRRMLPSGVSAPEPDPDAHVEAAGAEVS